MSIFSSATRPNQEIGRVFHLSRSNPGVTNTVTRSHARAASVSRRALKIETAHFQKRSAGTQVNAKT